MREIRDLKRKMILLLGIKLIFAGTFATAQDYDMLKRHKPKFEHSGFEKPDLLVNKKTKSEQEWWEPDTVWIFRADSEEFFGRVFFESNSQGLKTLELYQTRQNNIWENKKQWIYSYDTNNNLISRLDLDWQDDDWKNKTQKTCTYDIKNNLITELYQEWHNESWVNTQKSNFSYDVNNNIDTVIYQWWIEEKEYKTKSTLTYNNNNNLQTELVQSWRNDEWVNSSLSTYTYDDNTSIILIQRWDNGIFVNDILVTTTYDINKNKSIVQLQQWGNNSWHIIWQYY